MAELILNRNYFRFEDAYYLQRQGVVMGSASYYSNLLMGRCEEKFVYNNDPFSHLLKCWYCYIDEIFFIFSGKVTQLEDFKDYVNTRMPFITFSLEFSNELITFLDDMVDKNKLKLLVAEH